MEKKREKYIDIAKAFGIICVCISHSGTSDFFVTFAMLFVMPLFYFINGFLYNDYYSDHPWIRVKKSIISYYIPFLLYDLGYLLFHNVFAKLHLVDETNGGGAYSLKEYVERFFDIVLSGSREYFSGALWFLVAIMLITIGFAFENYFIRILKLEKYRVHILVGVGIVCLLFSLLTFIPKPMIIRRSSQGLFFFTLGYFYKTYDWNTILKKYKKSIILGAAVVLVFISTLNELDVFVDVYYNIPAVTIGSIFGIGMIFSLSQISVVQDIKILNNIGKSTLEIMALHFLAFKLVSWIIVMIYNLPVERLADYPTINIGGLWWILYVVVGVLVPYMCKNAYNKMKKMIEERQI